MSSAIVGRVRQAVDAGASAYHRLVLVVGAAHTGKTAVLRELADQEAWQRININLELSERLLEFTQRQRALGVARILADLVDGKGGDTVLVDNIELLFSPELKQDPLRLLQSLSRNRAIVAAWPGVLEGGQLLYAEPSHPEHRRYSKPEATIIPTAEAQVPSECSVAGAKAQRA